MPKPIKYQYDEGGFGVPHRINARQGYSTVGFLEWNGGTDDKYNHVQDVYVRPDMQRKGIATKMWKHAEHISNQFDTVEPPKHSTHRTPAGDAWAKSVGGPLPKNKWAPMEDSEQ
jgi:hypothetical protein